MLRCYGADAQGRVHSLPALCRVKISRSKGVPADSLRILLYGVFEEELAEVYVYDDEELLFTAEVDEQIAKIGENSFTELICRSTAAVLLDNEAKPQNFVNPSCDLIFRNYAQPYGFCRYLGDNRCFQGNFSVPKGVSCYEVLEEFSRAVFGKSIKVTGDEVHFGAENERSELCFSDDGAGLPFTDFTYNRLRCRCFSTIFVKTQDQEDYSTVVADEDALQRGIRRERYMDVSFSAGEALIDVHRAIDKAKAKSEEISLVYPGRLSDALGAFARVSFGGKVYEGFEVESLDYFLTKDSEYTRLTLCRKEN